MNLARSGLAVNHVFRWSVGHIPSRYHKNADYKLYKGEMENHATSQLEITTVRGSDVIIRSVDKN